MSASARLNAGGTPHMATHKPTLITGGAGFVGTNLAKRLLQDGESVLIYDDLSRPGVERNLAWLQNTFGRRVHVEIADICDAASVYAAVERAGFVYHFAAQVAVTTSLVTPRRDFDVNVVGTLNVLEAMRRMTQPPPLLYTSTNKVYGALDDIDLVRIGSRYQPQSLVFAEGINEWRRLEFHSPYGCSKGSADQYVLDYARSYGLLTTVFRMSCIYGPHQFGTEDQGWVAHFLIRAMREEALTLFGDGCQVRDILFVEDLVDAMLLAREHMPRLAGQVFNMGGGEANSTSLLEIIARIEQLTGRRCHYTTADWRLGDQRYYVSDTRLFRATTGWEAKTGIDAGLRRLHAWLENNQEMDLLPYAATAVARTTGALHGKLG